MDCFKIIDNCVTLDFETDKIENRPHYPPKPVGLAIRWPDGESEYMSWGHPSGNNCTLEDVLEVLEDIWDSDLPILFFNGKFDLAVAYEKLGLPALPWDRIHDAMFLAFLADPHAKKLDLKSLAENMLGWPPEERDAIAEYVWENRKELIAEYGGKIGKAKGKQAASNAGAWLSKLDGKMVGKYAIGDVDRTWELFEHLFELIVVNGMEEAYDRERAIMPIFMENERDGIHVDLDMLERNVPKLEASLQLADDILGELLGVPGLNINADQQFADALSDADVILDHDWVMTTPTKKYPLGQRSVSKDNLPYDIFQDEEIAHLYFYRNKLSTAVNTFLKAWLVEARQRDGLISTNWNQVRGTGGGARTGRPSTTGNNFLNIPKEFKPEHDMEPGNEYGLEPLPYVRDYMLPDPGQVWIHRDFDGQEMRIFAHYSDGPLLKAFQDDPATDPHKMVSVKMFEITGDDTFDVTLEDYDRVPVKTLNFLALYGGGIPAAAKKLECTTAKAREFKQYHDEALPERKWLNDDIKAVLAEGVPIRTWGGRCYFAEARKLIDGRMRDFLYKMINYLCQGSAADITKEVIIRWYYHPERTARFLLTVYDEINISCPEDEAEEQMALLTKCMESAELDLLMKTSGKIGARWGELEECD